MIPDPINPKRISTNNCRSANRQLSSRDGTYVSQCHANLTISISISFTNFNFSTTIHFIITIPLSASCTFAIPYNILTFNISDFPQHNSLFYHHKFSPLKMLYLYTFHVIPDQWPSPNRIIYIYSFKFLYMKIIVFERHPIAYFVEKNNFQR